MMRKKTLIIIGIVFLLLCGSVFVFMKFEYNEKIKIAIYPEGMYNESYCFELTPTGKLLVEKGVRKGDELTQRSFIQSENPNIKNVIFEYQKEDIRISNDATNKIYSCINEIYEEENIVDLKQLMDIWNIQILYRGKLIKQNLHTEDTLPQINDLVYELIAISPIKIDLHDFA